MTVSDQPARFAPGVEARPCSGATRSCRGPAGFVV